MQSDKAVAKRDRSGFKAGFMHGLPIGMGYLSVSFSFGVLAVSLGLTWWQAVLVSATSVTSAGQVAGISIMAASGSLWELLLSQLVINIRYSLMSISLSQKADDTVNKFSRLFLSFLITDEVFGVAGSREVFGRRYFLGLMQLPFIGWVAGTFLGSLLGSVLPKIVTDALAIGIYGMFIAIVLPVARSKKRIAVLCLVAIALSCLFTYVKFFSFMSASFAAVISAVIAAAVGAFVLPVEKDAKEVSSDA